MDKNANKENFNKDILSKKATINNKIDRVKNKQKNLGKKSSSLGNGLNINNNLGNNGLKNALSKRQANFNNQSLNSKQNNDLGSNNTNLNGKNNTSKSNYQSNDSSKGKSLGSNPSNSSSESKKTSNSNNSGFGNNKSGLFSNPLKPNINKNSSGTGEILNKAKKVKKIAMIASVISPIVLPIIFTVIIAVIIMAQIMTVRDFISQLVEQFTTGVEKLVNFTEGNGWMTNEDAFFSYLDKEYKKFPSTVTTGSTQLDIPLIAATIHYSKTTDLEAYEESEGTSDSSYTSDDFEQLGSTLSKDQTVSFYKVAKDKLGSVNSVWPGQKRLLGHIVKTRLVEVDFFNYSTAVENWKAFFSLFNQTVVSTATDVYWNTPIKYVNPVTSLQAFISAYNEAEAYKDLSGDALAGLKYDAANLAYEAQEFVNTFKELFEKGNSVEDKDLIDENGNVKEEAKSGLFLAPVIKRTMNYGYEEYKQMKQDLLEMKAILSKSGYTVTTEKETLDASKDSSDANLKKLYKDYQSNKDDYDYSYTHYLREVYIPFTYFYNQEYNSSEVDAIVEEIFDQRDFYNYLIGEDFNYSCGGSCIYPVGGQEIDNLKVRLLQCKDGDHGKPIPGEELVDFEKYILGVVYAEIGPDAPAEAAKVEAIAARSYALTRAKNMNNAYGLKLEKENGNWILSIRNCTEDQVYCDPDKGCSNTVNPNTSGNSTTLYSGSTTKPYTYKGPLSNDSLIRSAVSEVAGQVLLDKNGDIVTTSYRSTDQNNWKDQAREGMDYTEILMNQYKDGATISNSLCSNVCSSASGDYTQWKQMGESWSDIVIGSGQTIGQVGCLVTSVSMQIARSGVDVNVSEFNPGTFVEAIKPEGFNGANFVWASTTIVAPNFVYQSGTSLSGLTQSAKAAQVQSLINQGCYLVMEVKGNGGGQHWVAVDYVSGNDVYMMDPASTSTLAWQKYPHYWTTQVQCYKVTS